MSKINLTFMYSEPGFCRHMFSYRFNGKRKLACLQLVHTDVYELLGCTSDHEPTARLKFDMFEIPAPYNELKIATAEVS